MAHHNRVAKELESIYRKLYLRFGPQHWWPAESPFEVIIGAILTQNTAWTNVEKAICSLKRNKLLHPQKLYHTNTKMIAQLIRSCGYYNIKAARLKNFLEVLFADFKGNLSAMLSLRLNSLREKLLKVKGIGPETADSILLYAAKKPTFVVDAYTRRFLLRRNLIQGKASYNEIKTLFENNLPRRQGLFSEYHALIVRLAKEFCRTEPRCNFCPLKIER